PPNVVETDPRSWMRMVTGIRDMTDLVDDGEVSASGSRAGDVAHWMPLFPL
ncbi:hypothetical protein G3I15_40010, partial [Streptomyces sp. SID10244]|nr:hypothetical protein [Streptomyces sp. SID10244]